jgi:hypothetical protein
MDFDDNVEAFFLNVEDSDLFVLVNWYAKATGNETLNVHSDLDDLLSEKTPTDILDVLADSPSFDNSEEYVYYDTFGELRSYESVSDFVNDVYDMYDFTTWLNDDRSFS